MYNCFIFLTYIKKSSDNWYQLPLYLFFYPILSIIITLLLSYITSFSLFVFLFFIFHFLKFYFLESIYFNFGYKEWLKRIFFSHNSICLSHYSLLFFGHVLKLFENYNLYFTLEALTFSNGTPVYIHLIHFYFTFENISEFEIWNTYVTDILLWSFNILGLKWWNFLRVSSLFEDVYLISSFFFLNCLSFSI